VCAADARHRRQVRFHCRCSVSDISAVKDSPPTKTPSARASFLP
jgi:hypothetical protein